MAENCASFDLKTNYVGSDRQSVAPPKSTTALDGIPVECINKLPAFSPRTLISFYEEAGRARATLQSTYHLKEPPLKRTSAPQGPKPTPPLAALAQASRKCTFAQLAGESPVPNAACGRKKMR